MGRSFCPFALAGAAFPPLQSAIYGSDFFRKIHAATLRLALKVWGKGQARFVGPEVRLVNRAGGRLYDPVLSLDPEVFGTDAEVWIDLERRRDLEVNAEGKLKLPSFAHAAIVTVKGKE